jgi:hypothetical protein
MASFRAFTQRGGVVVSETVMKLNSDDYENIYLRVERRLWKTLAALFGLTSAVAALAAWAAVSAATERAVNRYVQTDEFRTSVTRATTERAGDLAARLDGIQSRVEQAERRVGALAGLPVAVSPSGMSVVDPSGRHFFIETGSTHGGEWVKFQSAFTHPPLVVLNSASSLSVHSPFADPRPLLAPADVTVEGFKVTSRLDTRTYTWLAVGQ